MKKNSAGSIFIKTFLQSLCVVIAMLLVGFGSYKAVLFYYSVQDTKAGSSNKTENTTEAATNQSGGENSKVQILTGIYVDDPMNTGLDLLYVQICNTKTKNMDYVMIPTETQVTLEDETYQKMKQNAADLPQEVKLGEVVNYYADGEVKYEMLNLAVSDLLGVDLDYYDALNKSSFAGVINLLSPQEYDVSQDMKFQDENGINIVLSKGTQSISGQQAFGLVTGKDGYADAITGQEQTAMDYLSVYVNARQSMEGQNQYQQYWNDYYGLVTSNGLAENTDSYLNEFYATKAAQVYFHMLEGQSADGSYTIDTAAVKSQIQILLDQEAYTTAQNAGSGVAGGTDGTTASAAGDSKSLSIAIYNSANINGLAGKWKEKLTADGYTINKLETDRSAVLTDARILVREEGQGQDLLAYFPNAQIQTGDVPDGIDIQIYLGTANDL